MHHPYHPRPPSPRPHTLPTRDQLRDRDARLERESLAASRAETEARAATGPLSRYEYELLKTRIEEAVAWSGRTDIRVFLRRQSERRTKIRENDRFPHHFDVVVVFEDPTVVEGPELFFASRLRVDDPYGKRGRIVDEYEASLPLTWTTVGGKRVWTWFEFRSPPRVASTTAQNVDE